MKLNTMYLDIIRDKIDGQLKKRISPKISESFIADNLARAYEGKLFKVNFVELKPSDKTFVMCCYPDVEELNNMTAPLMDKLNNSTNGEFVHIWNNIRTWHIEIDERVLKLGNPLCVDNGSQFVAILCHELGHIMNTFPASLALNYKYNKGKAEILQKLLLNDPGRVILLLCLPMFVCVSGLRIIVSKPGQELNEFMADSRVPDNYKPYLIDYAKNHIISNPETASGIIVTPQEYDHEQQMGIEFSRSCIRLMKKRNTVLKIHLSTFQKLSPSKYLQGMSDFILKRINPDDPHTNFVATESLNADFEKTERQVNTLLESLSDVTDRDLLLLQIDIDGMKTLDDKAYVINTICDYMERLKHKREKTLKKCKDITKIPSDAIYDQKMKTLDQMKKQVMDTKITSYSDGKEYSVYVKYPEGYEG